MGWWSTNEDGVSFISFSEEVEMVWGDSVADILDAAIDRIDKEFQSAWGRRATTEELVAGVRFSLGGDMERESIYETKGDVH